MQDAEYVFRGLLKRLVVGVVLSTVGIEEFVNWRQMQNLHWSAFETSLDQTGNRLLGRLNPEFAICCLEDSQGALDAVLRGEEQHLMARLDASVGQKDIAEIVCFWHGQSSPKFQKRQGCDLRGPI